VSAFLFYSCWSRPDRRYIIGIYSMLPFLITEGVFGSVDLLRGLARRHGERVARPFAVVLGVIALGVAAADIPLPPLTQDATFLSKGVLPVFTWLLPLTIAFGAFVAAARPSQRVTAVLAPALAVILVGFAVVRADATRLQRAPFQRPQATLARETLRRTLEPRSVVITSEDMGRPAENIEYYGGVPAFYLTDLQRWGLTVAGASTPFILKHVRPYLLIDAGVPERASILADLAEHGFVAERVLEVPPNRNMEYFVAAPVRRNVGAEIFRLTHPEIEALMRKTGV